jgi:hypothetical protein
MTPLLLDEIVVFVEENVGQFHQRRLHNLEKLKLKDVLKRKNPYLFKAKYIVTAQDLVKLLLDAHLSSQEEAIFGEFLEGLAIFVNGKVYGGRKSAAEGLTWSLRKKAFSTLFQLSRGQTGGTAARSRR